MKRKFTLLTRYLAVVACVLLVAGCSCTSTKEGEGATELTSLIGDNATVAAIVSVDAIIETSGIVDGKLPAELNDLGDDDVEEGLKQILSIEGYDRSAVLVLFYDKGDNTALVTAVVDEDKLTSTLKGAGFEVEDGVYVKDRDDMSVVLRDNLCWIVPSDNGATEIVDALVKEAENKPLADWKKEQLQAFGDKRFYGFVEVEQKYCFFNLDFAKNAADGSARVFNADGTPFVEVADNAGIGDLCKYVDRNAYVGVAFAGLDALPQLAALASVPELREYTELTTFRVAANINGAKDLAGLQDPGQAQMLIVLEATPGNAKALLAKLVAQIESYGLFECTGNDTHRELDYFGVYKYTLDVEGDNLVVRAGNVNVQNPIVADSKQQILYLSYNLPSELLNAIFNVPMGIEFAVKVEADLLKVHVEITNTDKGFMHALVSFGKAVSESRQFSNSAFGL